MTIRPATSEDLPALLELYADARAFMANCGNPNQWGSSHPPVSRLELDIQDGVGYVAIEQETLAAAFALLPSPDPTYSFIEGSWPNERPYGVVHRMACRLRGRGIASACLDWCKKRYDTLRIDTHQDNRPMKRLVSANGFSYCGVIYLENGDPRLAYQWDREAER